MSMLSMASTLNLITSCVCFVNRRAWPR